MERIDHILVVDDDRDIRELIVDYLEKSGYRASGAANGKAMWSVLKNHQIDLIVLDIMMPGEDGLTLCRQLRANPQQDIPVLMLTARTDDSDRILGLEMGADDYLIKPFVARELLARIKAILRRTRALPPNLQITEAGRLIAFGDWLLDTAARHLLDDSGAIVALSGALMLFLLGWCGAALIARLRRGQAFGERLRRLAGGAMLASVALIASGGDRYLQSAGGLSQALEQRLAARLPQPEQKTSLQPIAAPQPSSAMPSLAGGSAWINSPALTPERLKGKVVLVDFWTRECINCQHTLPYVRDWANKYRAAGLVVIGVHTPEYPWERSLPLLRQAVKDWRITYPVVADNEYAIWNAFGNQYWPAHYIFDARGQLRYTAFGEGDYARQEQVIQQLLQESKA
ncbi:TPA: response regulator [Klebsiella pneumoniae]|nr:response regulator [Klebsiella pneumoniae]